MFLICFTSDFTRKMDGLPGLGLNTLALRSRLQFFGDS